MQSEDGVEGERKTVNRKRPREKGNEDLCVRGHGR
jgi:hypothetical protein